MHEVKHEREDLKKMETLLVNNIDKFSSGKLT